MKYIIFWVIWGAVIGLLVSLWPDYALIVGIGGTAACGWTLGKLKKERAL